MTINSSLDSHDSSVQTTRIRIAGRRKAAEGTEGAVHLESNGGHKSLVVMSIRMIMITKG